MADGLIMVTTQLFQRCGRIEESFSVLSIYGTPHNCGGTLTSFETLQGRLSTDLLKPIMNCNHQVIDAIEFTVVNDRRLLDGNQMGNNRLHQLDFAMVLGTSVERRLYSAYRRTFAYRSALLTVWNRGSAWS